MDSPVSKNPNADIINNVRDFYFKIESETQFPSTLKSKGTLVKYTKLPDFDFDAKVVRSLKPRLRRIIEIDHPELQTSRSLKLGTVSASRMNPSTKRKMVSITENEEDRLTPSFGRVTQSSHRSCSTTLREDKSAVQRNALQLNNSVKCRGAHILNRLSGTTLKDDKSPVRRSTVKPQSPDKCRGAHILNRLSGTTLKDDKSPVRRSTVKPQSPDKYVRGPKLNAKPTNMTNKKEYNNVAPKSVFHTKQTNVYNNQENTRSRNPKDKEQTRLIKSTPNHPKVNLSKNNELPIEDDKLLKSIKNSNGTAPSKQIVEKKQFKSKSPYRKSIAEILNKVPQRNPISVIHVPLEECHETIESEKVLLNSVPFVPVSYSVDCGTDMDKNLLPRDANVGTAPQPTMVNEETETSNNSFTAEVTTDVFDNLDIPNVTLIKDRSNFAKEEIVSFCSRSMPNLQASPFRMNPEKESYDNLVGSGKSKTYIIGRATLTYTTKQKINFHVVGSSDDSQSNPPPSPLAYPLNVVSLLKRNLSHSDMSESSEEHVPNKSDKSTNSHNSVNELQALACPDVFNNNKLVKPSDLISTIRVNNGLLQNDYMSEQFQRELHFIDSFFESLQYLESCSLSEKCLTEASSDNWVSKARFDLKNSEYNSFLSKLENGAGALANVDDIETMASKSLCLLNLLIRNEQRRAKNLLFVLKMREDALKDFTKSQIIWLENKKKQDNTDVSTLKKKQRGALLKLQHECGEMQRMRKALLALSERRKAALMKTRNTIELKLKNNVDVDQILLGKKKLKRSISADRNVAPLKCFDLSSSGCEESSPAKAKETAITLELPSLPSTNLCVEKCVQTVENLCEQRDVTDHTTSTAENFVAVDGAYLNILFQNLSLPQIFSSGKQYEVNEEALRNIVESSNKPHVKDHCDSDVVENLMEKIRSRDSDRSSSASTAHSLLDEFDQYYKGLSDHSKSPLDSPDTENHSNISIPQSQVHELTETYVQVMDIKPDQSDKSCGPTEPVVIGTVIEAVLSSETLIHDRPCECEVSDHSTPSLTNSDGSMSNQTGPLPVPPGATSPEPVPPSDSSDFSTTSLGSSFKSDVPSVESFGSSSLGHNEAEELRRQQLAIEREIKALEQQQNQLLVVREIPDKPPPPYTPPSVPLAKVRMFTLTDEIEEKIERHVTHGEDLQLDPSDPLSVFINDICEESLARQQMDLSDQPWDACNLLPHKQELGPEKRASKAISEINQVLSGILPTVASGVGARRSDHIDDILFAEWRRCEPEWTTLHADEAVVKTQVFESLFQKILSETVDQYKQTVLGLITPEISEILLKKKS